MTSVEWVSSRVHHGQVGSLNNVKHTLASNIFTYIPKEAENTAGGVGLCLRGVLAPGYVSACLYWLPVCFSIDFNILLTTFKALHDLAPDYILDILIPYKRLPSLRSSGRGLLSLTESRLK